MNSLIASFADPEYEAKVGPDERNFSDKAKSQFAVSNEFAVLSNGREPIGN